MARVALLFSGGPAPAANAVINAAAMTLRRAGVEVIGIRNGYEALAVWDPVTRPLVEGRDWFLFTDDHLRGLRNTRGVLIGTARAHPGKGVSEPAHLADPERSAGLRRALDGLRALGCDGLVSIGGDGTLRTANMLARVQDHTPELPRVRVVHVPKTIDNDYRGIDFTFGFFTAVDTIAKELLNLRADAAATGSYFIVECMGRRAGWLSYGVAVAGEAHLVVGVEDVVAEGSPYARTEDTDGAPTVCLDLDALTDRIVRLIEVREAKGKRYGTIVLAEGLVERLPPSFLATMPRDETGMYGFAQLQIGRLVARRVAERFREKHGRDKKITGVQLGYESRCAAPHAFDVLLGAQLGVAAATALTERGLDRVMVSVSGQLEARFVPFADLIDASTLGAEVRFITPGSDFHRLAARLGTRIP